MVSPDQSEIWEPWAADGPEASQEARDSEIVSDSGGDTAIRSLVVASLTAALRDTQTPPAVRVQAARTLAEISGLIGKHARGPVTQAPSPETLSETELEAEIAALSRSLGV